MIVVKNVVIESVVVGMEYRRFLLNHITDNVSTSKQPARWQFHYLYLIIVDEGLVISFVGMTPVFVPTVVDFFGVSNPLVVNRKAQRRIHGPAFLGPLC